MIGQWVLLMLYVLIGVANVIRATQAWVFSPVLTATSLPLSILGAGYLVLGALFIVVGALYVRKPGRETRRLVRGLALAYQITLWLIRMLGVRAAYARRLWGRDLVLTVVFLTIVFLVTETRFRLRR